jgi:DNA-binding transcriptional ArsR family regulator
MGIIEVPDDLLREGFVQVPVKLLKLPNIGLGSKLCYCCLLWYAWKVGYFPGQQALAKEFGTTDRSVRNYFRELEGAGLIELRRPARRGEMLSIRLTPSSEWPGVAGIEDAGARGVVTANVSSPEPERSSRRKNLPVSPEAKRLPQRKSLPATQERLRKSQRQDLPGILINRKGKGSESIGPAKSRPPTSADGDKATKSNRKAQSNSMGIEESNIFSDIPQHYLMAMIGFARGLLERGKPDHLVLEVLQSQGLKAEQAEEVLRILRERY